MQVQILQGRIRKTLKYCSKNILFATASPRRRELANKICFISPNVDLKRKLERSCGISRIEPVFSAENVKEVVLSNAKETAIENARIKGMRAMQSVDVPVLAFDTVVGLDNVVFGKPHNREQAIEMFKTLCGRTHEVVTAVFCGVKDKATVKYQTTRVTFNAFDENIVNNYVDSGASYDKAGGYNLKDIELAPLIANVDGDRDNVIGLPIMLTEKLIEEYVLYGEIGYSN